MEAGDLDVFEDIEFETPARPDPGELLDFYVRQNHETTQSREKLERMMDNTDINAGTILEGKETINQVGERLYQLIFEVANGKQTKAEEQGENLCQVWRRTVVL